MSEEEEAEAPGARLTISAISRTRITIIIPRANLALDTSGSHWCLQIGKFRIFLSWINQWFILIMYIFCFKYPSLTHSY